MSPPPALKTLLAVESIAVDVARSELADVNAGVTEWALKCCRRIRDALTTGDAARAVYAGCKLGQWLDELRRLGNVARIGSHAQRAHARDVERREAYLAARNRGFSTDRCL